MTYICLGDIQAVVVIYSPLNVMVAILHIIIPLMWFHALQTEDLQVMLPCCFLQMGQRTHLQQTLAPPTNQHLYWGIYDYMALVPVVTCAGGCMTDWQGQPLTLQSHVAWRGQGKNKTHWKLKIMKIYSHPWVCSGLAYVCVCVCVLMLICKVITVVTVGLVHSLMCEIVGDRC